MDRCVGAYGLAQSLWICVVELWELIFITKRLWWDKGQADVRSGLAIRILSCAFRLSCANVKLMIKYSLVVEFAVSSARQLVFVVPLQS
jgi:hypothetical protein